ncbi:MAG: hypothetical protein ACKOFI_04220, partial [Phycisphaerales bacterium]
MAPSPAPPAGAKPPSKPPAAVAVLVQLLPAGKGRLVGEFDPSGEVKPGDPVILSDATWKPGARRSRGHQPDEAVSADHHRVTLVDAVLGPLVDHEVPGRAAGRALDEGRQAGPPCFVAAGAVAGQRAER